jgi:tRNA(fMet)-specific endonuclease VapC
MLSLDSNVLIDLVNGKHPVLRKRYDAVMFSGDPIVVSALVAHELIFGALISRRPDVQIAAARSILGDHEIVDWSIEDAWAAARLRAELHRQGAKIGSFDTLIAGQALNRGWTVVTANQRHFSRVEGLAVDDWLRPAS